MFDQAKRIIVSPDVIFEENYIQDWNGISEEEQLSLLDQGDNIVEDNTTQEGKVTEVDINSLTGNNLTVVAPDMEVWEAEITIDLYGWQIILLANVFLKKMMQTRPY